MANFYITDGDGLLVSFGYAPDGAEQAQARDGHTCTIGDAPCPPGHNEPFVGARWHVPTRSWRDTRSVELAKAQAWQRVKNSRARAEAGGFTWDGSVFQTDLQRIPSAALLALLAKTAGQPYAQEWTLLDNTKRPLDADDMIGVGVAQGEYLKEVRRIGDTLRNAIADECSHARLDLIAWPTA